MRAKTVCGFTAVFLFITLIFFAFFLSEHARNDASDWMAMLDDNIALNTLTIPGTHDSAARYSIADIAGKCQSLSIEEQLKAGVRFFDIRLQLRGDTLAVVHSFVDQLTDFDDVLSDMNNFLQTHPTEFLLVSIKEDASPKNAKTTFAVAVEAALSEYSEICKSEQTLPQTVADARGKMHIISRYADAIIGVPAYDGWHDNAAFTLDELYIQDHYAITDSEEKLCDIDAAFAVAAQSSYPLVLNYTSCYQTNAIPLSCAAIPAKTILPWLSFCSTGKEYIGQRHHHL